MGIHHGLKPSAEALMIADIASSRHLTGDILLQAGLIHPELVVMMFI